MVLVSSLLTLNSFQALLWRFQTALVVLSCNSYFKVLHYRGSLFLLHAEAVSGGVPRKKLFFKISQYSQEIFNFYFAKFLRTSILKIICEWLLLFMRNAIVKIFKIVLLKIKTFSSILILKIAFSQPNSPIACLIRSEFFVLVM